MAKYQFHIFILFSISIFILIYRIFSSFCWFCDLNDNSIFGFSIFNFDFFFKVVLGDFWFYGFFIFSGVFDKYFGFFPDLFYQLVFFVMFNCFFICCILCILLIISGIYYFLINFNHKMFVFFNFQVFILESLDKFLKFNILQADLTLFNLFESRLLYNVPLKYYLVNLLVKRQFLPFQLIHKLVYDNFLNTFFQQRSLIKFDRNLDVFYAIVFKDNIRLLVDFFRFSSYTRNIALISIKNNNRVYFENLLKSLFFFGPRTLIFNRRSVSKIWFKYLKYIFFKKFYKLKSLQLLYISLKRINHNILLLNTLLLTANLTTKSLLLKRLSKLKKKKQLLKYVIKLSYTSRNLINTNSNFPFKYLIKNTIGNIKFRFRFSRYIVLKKQLLDLDPQLDIITDDLRAKNNRVFRVYKKKTNILPYFWYSYLNSPGFLKSTFSNFKFSSILQTKELFFNQQNTLVNYSPEMLNLIFNYFVFFSRGLIWKHNNRSKQVYYKQSLKKFRQRYGEFIMRNILRTDHHKKALIARVKVNIDVNAPFILVQDNIQKSKSGQIFKK